MARFAFGIRSSQSPTRHRVGLFFCLLAGDGDARIAAGFQRISVVGLVPRRRLGGEAESNARPSRGAGSAPFVLSEGPDRGENACSLVNGRGWSRRSWSTGGYVSTTIGMPTWFAIGVQMSASTSSVSMVTTSA